MGTCILILKAETVDEALWQGMGQKSMRRLVQIMISQKIEFPQMMELKYKWAAH